MVFTSQIFVFYFLPLVLGLYYVLPRRGRNLLLTLASYVFYGWWNPWFVSLMLVSTLLDYGVGCVLSAPGASPRRRKLALTCSVCGNLGLLAYFKYFVFAQENLASLLMLFGREPWPIHRVILPVGISFYTFQTMSYAIDLYRGRAKPARSLVDFACFVSLFPQLIAGPIVRYQELADQLGSRPERGQLFHQGALLFMLGFAKKVLLANTVGETAELVIGSPAQPWHVAWYGILTYSLQLYFDFSGYSDMAIGLGRMFGFELPENFLSPYKSASFTEVWGRWHVSLSTWLRDYLYVPLGGNRGSSAKTYRNLLLTMTLGGVWHGASWNCVLWGAVNGALLAWERALGKRPIYSFLPRPLRVLVTYWIWLMTLAIFRSDGLFGVGHMFDALFSGRGDPAAGAVLAARAYQPYSLFFTGLAAIGAFVMPRASEICERARTSLWRGLLVLALFLLALVAMFSQAENPFLYFQF